MTQKDREKIENLCLGKIKTSAALAIMTIMEAYNAPVKADLFYRVVEHQWNIIHQTLKALRNADMLLLRGGFYYLPPKFEK